MAVSAFGTIGKTIMAGLKPIFSMVSVYLKYKAVLFQIKATINILKFAYGKMNLKQKAATAGVVLLAAAGKTGQIAMAGLGKAASLVAFGFAAAANPIAAIQIGIVKATAGAMRLTGAIMRLTKNIVKMSIAAAAGGLKKMFSGIGGMVSGLAGKIAGVAKGIGLLAVVGVGWGIKLAAEAESAQVGFETMLKSGSQAKALLVELEKFAASTPFALDSLRDGAKQLLNAGVSVQDITGKLRELGDIAAGTGKPINDFVRIFSKVKSTGKVSLETLNQLAERGVPIYSALSQSLGVTRKEMLKMISKGKVGFDSLNQSMGSLANGSGVFAGGMAKQSLTLSGLFSTLKDNLSFVMREIGVEMSNAFDFKGMMDRGIVLFQSIRAKITELRPAFVAAAGVIKSAFTGAWDLIKMGWEKLTSAIGSNGDDFIDTFVEIAAMASYAFRNIPQIFDLIGARTAAMAETIKEDLKHVFMVIIPNMMSKLPAAIAGMMSQIAKNSKVGLTEIAVAMSGGASGVGVALGNGTLTKSMDGAFSGLGTAFADEMKDVKGLAARGMTDLEKTLNDKSKAMSGQVADGMSEAIIKARKELEEFRNRDISEPSVLNQDVDPLKTSTEEQSESENVKKRTTFVVEGLNRGSQASLDAIYSASGNADKIAKKQLAANQKSEQHLKDIASKEAIIFQVAPAVG